ncbi:altered inheritance of mitochondria protein 32-like [Cucurbita pepo subsp. pepo]|uniref:altered inheritance of mitochondria protein 32-like n=1 Tax=Cucurbita pepo subsp. pepo TaxID=3664 RepID=UPI000C9D47D4|nr:altered inheritance of mitochondria protein 32-like [Cucurbita pepo subsp. pepo]XP_023536217.1 altered inheritance of mitochondria protein 32-like [Cucurbita pepo subsp. pepo]XP_023536224.1 altered inheritance of mitochondria protein 32-like [Cucurbita pepo subsp. pepo]XP_023536231.1 altered inheritance of mitochondria protein 32-like [Cucurbita pepo subsp. pepo]XP_023536238.1 altered inheritance of mitochondria protein 32-like [Cucurbita pepo subsp. pepo]XP_023536247.1 altered inheritance 
MASDNLDTVSGADDEKFGFRREEMYQSSLAGTVSAYDRHVFLCYKTPEAWPSHLEASDSDALPRLLSAALKARKDDISVKTKLTMFAGREETGFSDGDVLIFPEMVKYRGLKESDVDGFVDDVLVNDKQWASGVPEAFTGSHVFVCVHASRDRRCGVCGPALVQKLDEEVELRGLKERVFVSACSHIGGHKYAGNLIIYQPGVDGKTTGHWYGYVTPEDVSELFELHIAKGEVVERLLRGQMGTNPEEGKKEDELKIPNGEDTKKSKVEIEENSGQSKVETIAGCCQGSNGFTCCRDESSGKSSRIENQSKEASEEQVPKKANKFSCWTGQWEQSEILAAAAIIGAVASVAVAYSLYRRSG